MGEQRRTLRSSTFFAWAPLWSNDGRDARRRVFSHGLRSGARALALRWSNDRRHACRFSGTGAALEQRRTLRSSTFFRMGSALELAHWLCGGATTGAALVD